MRQEQLGIGFLNFNTSLAIPGLKQPINLFYGSEFANSYIYIWVLFLNGADRQINCGLQCSWMDIHSLLIACFVYVLF